MSKLSLSVRIAAGSICALSLVHVFFWAYLATISRAAYPDTYPYTLLSPIAFMFSMAGLVGVLVGVGIFRARPWARIATLVLAALVAFFCAFAILVIVGLLFVSHSTSDLSLHGTDFALILLVYFAIFAIALWWIILFSRRKVVAQFSNAATLTASPSSKKPACPPPIALLAWLMILSGALSAVSWSLILGKIPAMLFTHIFSSAASKWIWIANIALFLACGAGLLRLQRWSYNGTIFLHIFWLVSVFVTQLSESYESYSRVCLDALNLAETYPLLNRFHPSPWISAIATAVPTALLIAGLFYYRRSFLQAVADSRHLSS